MPRLSPQDKAAARARKEAARAAHAAAKARADALKGGNPLPETPLVPLGVLLRALMPGTPVNEAVRRYSNIRAVQLAQLDEDDRKVVLWWLRRLLHEITDAVCYARAAQAAIAAQAARADDTDAGAILRDSFASLVISVPRMRDALERLSPLIDSPFEGGTNLFGLSSVRYVTCTFDNLRRHFGDAGCAADGAAEGAADGAADGAAEGAADGAADGAAEGEGV